MKNFKSTYVLDLSNEVSILIIRYSIHFIAAVIPISAS